MSRSLSRRTWPVAGSSGSSRSSWNSGSPSTESRFCTAGSSSGAASAATEAQTAAGTTPLKIALPAGASACATVLLEGAPTAPRNRVLRLLSSTPICPGHCSEAALLPSLLPGTGSGTPARPAALAVPDHTSSSAARQASVMRWRAAVGILWVFREAGAGRCCVRRC